MKNRDTTRRVCFAVLFIILPSAFCVLNSASAAEGPAPSPAFRLALPNYEFEFPRDHGSHDDFRTEWWYYTGHLTTDQGKRYGFEVTFFRVGVVPPGAASTGSRWELQQLSLAHFAITDVARKEFRYYEKLARSSPFTARAAQGRLDVFNEGWRASTNPDGSWQLVAFAGKDRIELTLRARKAPAIHGENGISVKAQGVGYASHYYSMTRLDATGRINGRAATGLAWMDHEFGSSMLRENQTGWDWFSIQLDNETELMLYVIRRNDGTPDVTSSGSLVLNDGRVLPIRRDQMQITAKSSWRSAKSGATYPMGWRVRLPSFDVDLDVQPVMREQELITKGSTQVTYWEGLVDVTGSFASAPVRGAGYVEMTGYDKAFRQP